MALHLHGSNNPNGVTGSVDRYAFHPYFIFKDLVTIFLFLLALSVIVFFYPNLLGQQWPIIVFLIVNIINICAISWKYILIKLLVKIHNRTINISDLFNCRINIFKSFGLLNLIFNPFIVRYYYEIYNQQITKVICLGACFKVLRLRTHKDAQRDKNITSRNFRDYTHTQNENKNKYVQDILIKNREKISLLYNASCSFLLKNPLFFLFLRLRTHFNAGLSKTSRPACFTQPGIEVRSIKDPQAPNFKSSNYFFEDIQILDSHNNEISLKFKQWFAGITDGDGYIYVNKKGYIGFELTLPTADEKVLRIIQNKFGGNVHARAGFKAVRYRTQQKETITKIIHCLNGLIINNIRLSQLHKACQALNIKIKDPVSPTIDSAYISGLLDSDGTINIYKHNYNDTFRYQLTISIANKSRVNIEFLLNIVGGQIYFDKTDNGCYFWKANSKLLHLKLYDYFLKFPPKTIKMHRTYLIKEFHDLNESKIYRDTNILSMNYKIWNKFLNK
jgi:hypothetical protein